MRTGTWLAALAWSAVACSGQPDAASEPPRPAGLETLAPMATDGARAALVQADGEVLVLRVEARGVALGSVQGTLRFDPADFEILEATPATAAQVVVNATGAAGGVLRFAAFDATGLPSGDLLRLRVKVHRPLTTTRPVVRIEVAGTAEGLTLPAGALLVTEGIYRDPR